jgi:hypothetical protein
MNTKVAIGLVAAVIILGGVFFFTHTVTAPAALPETAGATTTAPVSSSSPVITPGAPSATPAAAPSASQSAKGVKHVAAFDMPHMVVATGRPKITGTANVKEIQVVIVNSQGVGIVGGMTVPVVAGHWQFTTPLALKPGSYTVQIGGVDDIVTGTLTVNAY